MRRLGQPSEAIVHRPQARDGWRTVLLGALGVLGALVAVLAVTGVVLTTGYRPASPGASDQGGGPDQTLRDLHRLAATLAQSVVLLATVAALGWSYRVGRRAWVGPAVVLVLVLLTSFVGNLLPFDQLALWEVTVGDQIEGAWFAAFDERVRFVLIGGAEVSQAHYQRLVLAHFALAASVVAGLVVVTRRLLRRDGDRG